MRKSPNKSCFSPDTTACQEWSTRKIYWKFFPCCGMLLSSPHQFLLLSTVYTSKKGLCVMKWKFTVRYIYKFWKILSFSVTLFWWLFPALKKLPMALTNVPKAANDMYRTFYTFADFFSCIQLGDKTGGIRPMEGKVDRNGIQMRHSENFVKILFS